MTPAGGRPRCWMCCATIKTPRPATICHTSDGGAAFGGQTGVKPEAARGGGPKGRGFTPLTTRQQKFPVQNTPGDTHNKERGVIFSTSKGFFFSPQKNFICPPPHPPLRL